jgi:hypothetical protein
MSTWWDRFGQEWGSAGLTDDPTEAQANVGWAFIGQAPPTVEEFNSMFQWNDDKDNWLYGQIANVIASAGIVPNETDLTQLLQAIDSKQKKLLIAALNIYVDTINGNDSVGDGTINNPWKTIQHAYNWVRTDVEQAGYTIVCNLKPGTYSTITVSGTPLNGTFFIYGDKLNPRSYTIKNTNGVALSAWYGSGLVVQGVALEATGTNTSYGTSGIGMLGSSGGWIVYQDIAFGPCNGYQMCAQVAGICYSNGPINYSIYGGGLNHFVSSYAGDITAVQSTVTVTGNPAFTQAFALSTMLGGIQAWTSTFTGAAQGVRAYVDANSVINIGGANPDTMFPGTQPSVRARGGLII